MRRSISATSCCSSAAAARASRCSRRLSRSNRRISASTSRTGSSRRGDAAREVEHPRQRGRRGGAGGRLFLEGREERVSELGGEGGPPHARVGRLLGQVGEADLGQAAVAEG